MFTKRRESMDASTLGLCVDIGTRSRQRTVEYEEEVNEDEWQNTASEGANGWERTRVARIGKQINESRNEE